MHPKPVAFRIWLTALSAAIVVSLSAFSRAAAEDSETFGKILRRDPGIDRLVPRKAEIEKLAEGFDWSEGPVWVRDGEYLLFSDIPPNTVFKWKEGEGISEFLKPSGYTGSTDRGGEPGSNGLLIDANGRLVLCEHGDRRVAPARKRRHQDHTRPSLRRQTT